MKVPQPGIVSVLIYAVILILIHFLSFACPTSITWSLDKGKEDKVNLNCSENDQQWRTGWVGGCVRKHGGHREECKGGGQGRERRKKCKEGGGRTE